MTTDSVHVSVLPQEVIAYLKADAGGRFLDCTLGGAGHTQAILDASEDNFVVAIDRDERALKRAKVKLAAYAKRCDLKHASFADLDGLSLTGEQYFTGILADLGLSSDQLAEERGFSFKDEGELDMRMDESQGLKAIDIVNNYTDKELTRMLRVGGMNKDAFRLAKAIVKFRPFNKVGDLVKCVHGCLGAKEYGKKVKDSATVVFQALRIEVNQEFAQIKNLLEFANRAIAPGGRLVVIAFHSLEDRMITKAMRDWQGRETASALWRGKTEGSLKRGRLLTGKAVTPSEEEVARNPRSRSARLRAFEFLV